MNRLLLSTCLLGAFASVAVAQPTIVGLQNNYSYQLPGTPNYALARGSIVVIYGTRMAPEGLLQQGFDPELEKNLGGVTIRITVNGVTTDGIPYYVSPGQIAAILPSATPVGNGEITVSYNGQTSAPFPIEVVESAFGLLTLSGNGLGQAAVLDAAGNYITPTNAAHPGQTVVLWGTGLGPDPNDETRLVANRQSLTNLPFEIYIGGKLAASAYHGRSDYPGLDQVNVTIPNDVQGCFVAAYVKTGAYLSNFTTIPIASEGTVCEEPFASAEELQMLSSQQTVRSGWVYLGKLRSTSPDIDIGPIHVEGSTTITDSATVQFIEYTPFNYVNYGGISQASYGSCVVSAFSTENPFVPPVFKFLDAGAVTLRLPPDGTVKNLQAGTPATTLFLNGSSTDQNNPLFIPEMGGTFTFTGSGGADVGPFQASISTSTPLVWSNRESIFNINRTQNLNITWTGGAPGTYVVITGFSTDLEAGVVTSFTCTEHQAAGHFTIPSDVLSSILPSVAVAGFPTGQLHVYNYLPPIRFEAPGVDNANIAYYTTDSAVVNYQ